MGFLSNLVSSAVKVALTPVAIIADVVEVASGGEAENTKELISSAGEDLGDSLNDLAEGEIL